MSEPQAPRLFISYCHSEAKHNEWVARLAEDLVGERVDVIWDRWTLREGHDLMLFMESIAGDQFTDKVLMICDANYVERANRRERGTGIEAQIITSEIYKNAQQTKFVAAVLSKNGDGSFLLPVFASNRIAVDFTDPVKYADKIEQVVRWCYDKPSDIRPDLGPLPAYISSPQADTISGLSLRAKRAIDAVRDGSLNALNCIGQYFNRLSEGFGATRANELTEDRVDELVLANVECFDPYMQDFISLCTAIAESGMPANYIESLHFGFDQMLKYLNYPRQSANGRRYRWDHDDYRYLLYEMFVYTAAALLKRRRLEELNQLLGKEFYSEDVALLDYREAMPVEYGVFCQPIVSLDDIRGRELNKNPHFMRATIARERCAKFSFSFRDFCQADFVLYLRSRFCGRLAPWFPYSLAFEATSAADAFDIFQRCTNKEVKRRVLDLLGTDSAAVSAYIKQLKDRQAKPPNYGTFYDLEIENMINYRNAFEVDE